MKAVDKVFEPLHPTVSVAWKEVRHAIEIPDLTYSSAAANHLPGTFVTKGRCCMTCAEQNLCNPIEFRRVNFITMSSLTSGLIARHKRRSTRSSKSSRTSKVRPEPDDVPYLDTDIEIAGYRRAWVVIM
jgi:hypothetical protein